MNVPKTKVRLEPFEACFTSRCPACFSELGSHGTLTDGDTIEAFCGYHYGTELLVGWCPSCGRFLSHIMTTVIPDTVRSQDFVPDNQWKTEKIDYYWASHKQWRWTIDHQCNVVFPKGHHTFPDGCTLDWVDVHFLGPFYAVDVTRPADGRKALMRDCSQFVIDQAHAISGELMHAILSVTWDEKG